ncbi:MAG: VOC family protein [Candidatus Zixiibacteriota bacterium]|nr:MAG: VOC family protein [candidate division Zixibacteria bacterium]
MPRIVHFEIHADDPERAAKFYTDVFDWNISKWDGPEQYWLCNTGNSKEPGINGGIMKRRDPAGSVYNTIDVPSVDEYVDKISENGGEIVVPKMAVPGVGWLAYFKDTEGNIFGIMQPDPSAK